MDTVQVRVLVLPPKELMNWTDTYSMDGALFCLMIVPALTPPNAPAGAETQRCKKDAETSTVSASFFQLCVISTTVSVPSFTVKRTSSPAKPKPYTRSGSSW